MTPSKRDGQTRVGIDLGGTKIEVIALDQAGAELFRRRVETPRDYAGSVQAIKTLIEMADDHTGDRGKVGIGIPGTISPVTGLVKNANSTWLIGHPLDEDLEDLLGRPVRLMNDAKCFALSEAIDGAGKDAKIDFEPAQKGDVPDTYADTTLAKEDMGFAPDADWEAGLKAEFEWVKEMYSGEK